MLALLAATLVAPPSAFAQTETSHCATEGAVADAPNNPGLVSDCDTLLAARDTLAGSASLNWSASTLIDQWDGITVGGSPMRVTGLELPKHGLTGEIPVGLGSLAALEWLILGGNQLTGCISAGLRDVPNSDLYELGMPFCDVLLSDLVVSPGSLIPKFDPYHTEYSISTGLLPVIVTLKPANEHNASFLLLDENYGEVLDGDLTLEGLQINFGGNLTTIKIKIVSQDKSASHTYTVTDLVSRYDTSDDGVIDRDEVISAVVDYFDDLISRKEVVEVIVLYFSDPPSPMEMTDALAWVQDGTTETEEWGLLNIDYLASRSPSGFRTLMRKPWIKDELSPDEIDVVFELKSMAEISGSLTDQLIFNILRMPFLNSIDSTDDDVLRILSWTHREWPGGLPEFLSDPRLNSGITEATAGVVLLLGLEQENPEAGKAMWAQPWAADGITEDEVPVIGKLVRLAYIDTPSALAAAEYFNVQNGDLINLAIVALASLQGQQEALDQLKAQPWFADGLDDAEAALVVTLSIASSSPELYNDLLRDHHTQHKTISFPIAGDVNFWIIENVLPSLGDDLLAVIENTARIAEGFLGLAFPTSDIILHVIESENYFHSPGTGHYGSHMVISRHLVDYPHVFAHETAHYYFTQRIFDAPWLAEGGADFIVTYVDDQMGVRDLADQRTALQDFRPCIGLAENIRHYMYLIQNVYFGLFSANCEYRMGESLLLDIHEIFGEEATLSALRELFSRTEGWRRRATEEEIYLVFLNHAPPDREEAFRDLYRELHGGAFAFDKAEFSDDHGDDVDTASTIMVGESASGTLDYMFDFDFFRFSAEEGQRYRMKVNHESLHHTGVTLYAPDGLTQEYGGYGNWKSRWRLPTGPQILWVAPSSGQYYFAVQNFGGKTGPYTVTIDTADDPEDDHGDTLATSTGVTLREVVEGVVDDDFDYDYFGFQAVEDKRYRVRVEGGTLDRFRIRLYAFDGAAPANWRRNRFSDGSSNGDLGTINWLAPISGQYYVAVDGAHGRVGTYTITITPIDN